MATLETVKIVGIFKHADIRESVDGVIHYRTLSPGSDISTEPPEVQAKCTEAWTPEVIEAYQTHLEATR